MWLISLKACGFLIFLKACALLTSLWCGVQVEDESYLKEEAEVIKVGDRCQAAGGRRGQVMFVGQIAELPLGWWVGVHYDEPVGKNDGSVKGARYFECPENYGGFIRPDLLEVGDFPEEDPFADLDDGDEM